MERQKEIFWETLSTFQEIGLLENLLLVGSWAEYIYQFCLKDFFPIIRTRDMDFLIKNIRRPARKINIYEVLESKGFIVDTDYLTGVTKFYKEGVLELEFLVLEKGRGQLEPYIVEPLGIKAEGLRHMDFLLFNSITVETKGIRISVPSPQAYLLHKLIINDQRQVDKKEKDIESVINLLEYINQDKELLETLKSLSLIR
ncbi:MAG: GSU2403 family nucleotidyltransferase fold protein [Bacillota bacterium]